MTNPNTTEQAKAPKAKAKPPKQTRQAQLKTLLSRATGASNTQIQQNFGWQPHTARAAISSLGKAGLEAAKPFDRGHIHHILSNPIYAGRIRHKGQVYGGQHPAIIDPVIWDQVQQMLKDGTAKSRGTTRKATQSLLAGKLFDETGDRLTPSHSQKNGKRLRYYISHRLVKDRSRKHPDAWRLPAEQLEGLIADLVREQLKRPDIATRLVRDLAASEVTGKSNRLHAIRRTRQCLHLIERADLSPGEVSVRLCQTKLASVLECDANRMDAEKLTLTSPFRMRRRGVELKLHLGDAPPEVDLTVVQNIVKAQSWMAMIIAGKTFTEIAHAEGVSKRRVQDIVDLAMLAPDILDAIAAGEQSDGVTSDRLIKSGVPAVWSEQRAKFAKL